MNQKENSDRIFFTIAILFSIALILLAVIRACNVPLTHDEAMSFNYYVHKSLFDIIGYVDTYGMPNNHILNTLLMKCSSFVFGNSALALRLPNLISLLLYLLFSFLLLRPLQSRWLRPAAFLLLCLNPYLFDFFSLARGYGIANGLLMISIYYLFKWKNNRTRGTATGIFFFASLMVLANFSTLHLFFAFALVFIFLNLKNEKPNSLRAFLKCISIPFIATLILGGVLYEPFRCIIKWKTTFGGTTGFWQDCVIQLIGGTSYGAPYSETMIRFIPLLVIALLVFMTAAFVLILFKKRNDFFAVVFALLIVPVLTMQLQHLLLNSEFPVARTVQFTYPLFMLAFIFGLDMTSLKLNLVLAYPAAILMLFHFLKVINLEYASEWRYDASNRMVIKELEKSAETKTVRLGISWFFEPGLNYELKYSKNKQIEPVTRDGVTGEYDFYYVVATDTAQLTARGKKIIVSYPQSNTFLLR